MPQYTVDVTRILEVSTTIEVTAQNEDDAEQKATELAEAQPVLWQIAGPLPWIEQDLTTNVDSVELA